MTRIILGNEMAEVQRVCPQKASSVWYHELTIITAMPFKFVNRELELKRLSRIASGMVVIYGRRRIGKTSLLIQWGKRRKGVFVYSQAIEASPALQLSQFFSDLEAVLDTRLVPTSWEQLFELVERCPDDLTLCIDEFPYLVAADPSIPSRFQRWIDHSKKANLTLVFSGSSTRMMHSSMLSEHSALYGRAKEIIFIQPMSYFDFCKAIDRESDDQETFRLFSLCGGVPKYWELLNDCSSAEEAASRLYFQPSAYLQREPYRLLRDEKIEGISPIAVLEAIGRGAHRSGEIAARVGVAQTTVSKVIQLLTQASVIERNIPFGSSDRNSKQSLYFITDPSVRFWYSVYSPHRSRWEGYSNKMKKQLLNEHTGVVLEQFFRELYPEGMRYWEKDIEIDMIRPDGRGKIVITEIKWQLANKKAMEKVARQLRQKWECAKLATKYEVSSFEVLDFSAFASKQQPSTRN